MDLLTLAARVAKGAALLDGAVPGWYLRIDLTTLDLGSCGECVLGQLFEGDYDHGVFELREPMALNVPFEPFSRPEVEHGFLLPLARLNVEGYDDLAAEWARVITARREQEVPA